MFNQVQTKQSLKAYFRSFRPQIHQQPLTIVLSIGTPMALCSTWGHVHFLGPGTSRGCLIGKHLDVYTRVQAPFATYSQRHALKLFQFWERLTPNGYDCLSMVDIKGPSGMCRGPMRHTYPIGDYMSLTV